MRTRGNMKKTLYTLNVGDYAPEMMKLTMPLMKRYAEKIGADFEVITDRKYPDFPIPCEKFQIKERAEKNGDEWSIFYDADALIHPDMYDPTEVVDKSTTISNGTDFVHIRFRDAWNYFKKDGRQIGKGNWCMHGSDWCRDLWNDELLKKYTKEELIKYITPTVAELGTVIEPEHLIDDFIVSNNIARFSFKHVLLSEIKEMMRVNLLNSHWHEYRSDVDRKVFYMKKTLLIWAADALANDERQQDIYNMINQINYRKDKTLDWSDFASVIPCGKRLIDVINSWGIDVKYKKFDDVKVNIKKDVLMSVIARMPDCQAKQVAANAINSLTEGVKIADFLGTLEAGQFIAENMRVNMDIDVKVTPKEKLGVK